MSEHLLPRDLMEGLARVLSPDEKFLEDISVADSEDEKIHTAAGFSERPKNPLPSSVPGFWCQTKGAVAVEFAIIGTLFILLIAGVLDFGHAWYMRQAITNASREGARYGITYQTNSSGERIAPSALNPTIQTYILTKYLANAAMPGDANPTVTLGGAGYTTGTRGTGLEVTVTATKTWFLLSGFIPGFGTQKTLAAKTVMLCE